MGISAIPHAAVRVATAIVAVLDDQEDPKTINQWSRSVGVSPSQLRAHCRSAGLTAKATLDFARLLRAVAQARSAAWRIQYALDTVDVRTVGRLLGRAGIGGALYLLTPEDFVIRQRLVSDPVVLREVTRLLELRPVPR